jgi:glycosyltransferase involved in cell wall biosynthesis
MKNKKILISSYALSPIRGSECGVGWEICTRLSQYYDVTVLMCDTTPSGDPYFEEVEEYIKVKPLSNIRFVPIKYPDAAKKYIKLHDRGFWPAYYWAYQLWQKEAYHKAVELHSKDSFQLVYQLNMIGFRECGYLWKLNIPFVWGPTNGFHSIPFSFIKGFRGKDFIFQSIKHISNEIQIKTAIRPRMAAQKASHIWCVDNTAYAQLTKWTTNKVEILQETGLSVINDQSKNRRYDNDQPLKISWSGHLVPGKALHILLQALMKTDTLDFHLTILGDGPLKAELQHISQPIMGKITWKGFVSKAEAMAIVDDSDLLIHTSLKEGTPHAVLEAIGMGVPVICHDTCGMGAVVNNNRGFKIPYKDTHTSINSLTNILNQIKENPEILNAKYKSIQTDIENLTWESKIEIINKSITQIISLQMH